MNDFATAVLAVTLAAFAGAAAAEGPITFEAPAHHSAAASADRAAVKAQVLQARQAGTLVLDEARLNAWPQQQAAASVDRAVVKAEAQRATARGEIHARDGEVDLIAVATTATPAASRAALVASR